MKQLTVFEYKNNNQWFWAWVDEFTGDYKRGYQTQVDAINNDDDSINEREGDYYHYKILPTWDGSSR